MIDAASAVFADQLQTAVREILTERGYDAEVSLATEKDGFLVFSAKCMADPKKLTPEVINDIIEEAVGRVGGHKIED